MSNFLDEGNNDYLFQDSLFDDLLNDLVYDDIGGDLVSFPTAEFTFEDPFLNEGNLNPSVEPVRLNEAYVIDQHEKAQASIPIQVDNPFPPSMNMVQDSPQNFHFGDNPNHNSGKNIAPRPTQINRDQSANKRKSKEVDITNDTIQRIKTLTLLPILIFKAFNGGDLPKVREIIREVTEKNCALKTPALDQDVYGQNNIMDLFQAIYDSHPDAVWVAKQCKLNEETNVIQCRVYFAGTRIGSMYKSSSQLDLNGSSHADYLYKRRNSSLLDEMDVNMLSPVEIDAMKELEKLSRNLSVFFKGSLDLEVNEQNDKITRFVFDWTITSFREAEI